MPYVIVRHKVEDYAKWYPVYTQHGATRKAGGSKSARLLRSKTDPNEITLIFEWDSLENAQKFVQSPDLRETMQKAGVIGMPDVHFLEEVEKTSA